MHTAVEQLNEQVRRVAEARRQYEAQKALVTGLRAAFEATHAETIAAMNAAAEVADQAEGALRALTLAHYEQTKEKKPVPGVEVKEKVALDYDAGAALAWARETKIALLPESLDAKAFEKIAKVTPLAFVKQVVTPQAQIAKDLDAVLETAADAKVAA